MSRPSRVSGWTYGNCSARFLDNDDHLDFWKHSLYPIANLEKVELFIRLVFVLYVTLIQWGCNEARQHQWDDCSQEQRLCRLTSISEAFQTSNSRNLIHLFNQSRIKFILHFYTGDLWTSVGCCDNWYFICRGGVIHLMTLNRGNNSPVWCKTSFCGFC